MFGIRRFVVAVVLCGAVVPAAHGALISGAVTSPADGAHFISDASGVAPPNLVTFSGTTSVDGGTIPVLRCYFKDSADVWDAVTFPETVTLDGAGGWSVEVNVSARAEKCLVRLGDPGVAVTAGPAATASGPTVYFGTYSTAVQAGGPNDGAVTGWEALSSQSAASNDHGSPSSLGLWSSSLLAGADARQWQALWSSVAAPSGFSTGPFPAPGGVIVDGLYGHTIDSAASVSLPNTATGDTLPGLRGMTVTPVIDTATGAIGSDQVVPVVRCNGGADQPDPTAACTAWVRTGVVLHRSVRFGVDGTTTRISDRWVSDDGAAHAVRVRLREQVSVTPNNPSFRFAWAGGATFLTHLSGETISPPPAGQWRMDVMGDSLAPDGDPQFARGATVVDQAPTSIVFETINRWVRVHDLSVPAGGETRMEQGYVMASTQAGVDAAATLMSDAISPPSVSITSPTNGSTVTTTPTTVTGVVTDSVGVASATLNGRPVTLGAGGAFTTSLVLSASPSTLTLVATDGAGNSSQTQVKVNFTALEFIGTDGPDVLNGNAQSNILTGKGGNDTISCGVGGADRVDAGAGDDAVDCVEAFATAGANADVVECGPGVDSVRVDPFDTVTNCESVTRVWLGSDGADRLTGDAADNLFQGLGGVDRITCGVGGRDRVEAGAGDDIVNCVDPMAKAKAGADTVLCDAGRDTAQVDPFDKVTGCERVTRVWIGSASRNVFRGTKANDRFDAKGGNDAVTCGGGKDVVLAGAGNDAVNCRDLVPKKANGDLVVCGAGVDSVIADKFDTVRGCEKVTRR